MIKRRILVVDDEFIFSEPITMALGRYGYKAVSASNGAEALKIIETNVQKFDLFLLDYHMPQMNGLMLLKKIRETRDLKDTPAIMLTEKANKELVFAACKLGVSDYILKSTFSLGLLLKTINAVLNQSETQLGE